MSYALPSYADVLEMIRTIPNRNDMERMIQWVQRKEEVLANQGERIRALETSRENRRYDSWQYYRGHGRGRVEQESANEILRAENRELERTKERQLREINDLKATIRSLESSRNYNDSRIQSLLDEKHHLLRVHRDTEWELEKKTNEKSLALLKLYEANSKLAQKTEQISECERKFIQQQQDNEDKLAELEAAHTITIQEMINEISVVDHALEKEELEKKFQEQIAAQSETIEKLKESVNANCEKLVTSQDKLIAQMEKNAELQNEVKELNEKIQDLEEDICSDDDDDDNEKGDEEEDNNPNVIQFV